MTDNKYWKGLEELHHEEEFEKHRYNEFAEKLPLSKVIKEDELSLSSNRRDFLKFMGFGITAATLAACSRTPVKNVVPYINKPVDIDPGVANYYATTCGGCNARCSLLVKTREGRPIKIEGNPDSPYSLGGVCAVGQGTVLSLYDLGRLSHPMANKKSADWKTIDKEVGAALQAGGNVRILTGTISSPSTKAVIDGFMKKHPGSKHIQYDAASPASGILEAHEQAFGKAVLPGFNIEKAKTLVSFGADFLGTWISPVEFTKKYVSARKADGKAEDFLFHIQFESELSLSGSNADHRTVLSPSQMGAALLRLHGYITGSDANAGIELAGNSIKMAADHLMKNKGKSLVICGSNDPDHQLIVASINSALGNYGSTIDIDNPSYQKQGSDKDMINLVNEMASGAVNTLFIHDCNPSYTYPDSKKFNDGLAKVKTSVSFSGRLDQTAERCTHVAPTHHFLESWGDDMPKEGYSSLYQPTISPIFNTRQAEESLLAWSGNLIPYDEFVKRYWNDNMYNGGAEYKNFNDYWVKTLEMGFVAEAQKEGKSYTFNGNLANAKAKAAQMGGKDDIEVVIYEKVAIRDGKDANNPWLQELPDPVSKVSWDNYAAISPKLADNMGLKDEDEVEISANGYTVKLPVLRQPGSKYNTVSIAKGYGQTTKDKLAFKVAEGVGANAFPFATITNDAIIYGGQKVTIKKTGGTYPLALSQTHHNMEGRDLVRETTIAEVANGTYYKELEKNEGEGSLHISLWKDYRFPGQHWGMAIDLNACTGCNACVVSCQAENNVPVVGKDEVRRRREMHWLRIDRYYSIAEDGPTTKHETYHNQYKEIDALDAKHELGNYEKVRVVFQPIMCQHCTNAPCESVCPVNAISHSSDGLNMQAYNRCVGTRYCANNCPYKVRRFNWFNYSTNDKFKDYAEATDLGRMVLNPDVTVRTRGVMEKCTLCVQRIQVGKLEAKKDGRPVKDGEIKTACQQTCPANAIVFGDMNNPESDVSKLIKNKRTYRILTELNTRPSVNYMSKVRNSPETIA
jgi:MoCo/4Fe-4S cofactor protein with predicted Tat translocation signal